MVVGGHYQACSWGSDSLAMTAFRGSSALIMSSLGEYITKSPSEAEHQRQASPRGEPLLRQVEYLVPWLLTTAAWVTSRERSITRPFNRKIFDLFDFERAIGEKKKINKNKTVTALERYRWAHRESQSWVTRAPA